MKSSLRITSTLHLDTVSCFHARKIPLVGRDRRLSAAFRDFGPEHSIPARSPIRLRVVTFVSAERHLEPAFSKMLLARPIGLLPLFRSLIPIASCIRTPAVPNVFVRHGSMKAKRIQKKQPLEKNRIHRLVRGTRLEVKKLRKKKNSTRNTDPMAYMDIQPVEFDPYDIRGRSTLKVPILRGTFFL